MGHNLLDHVALGGAPGEAGVLQMWGHARKACPEGVPRDVCIFKDAFG